ncbi:uncharacterized protein LOC142331696 [Lycorma delicatula]|uniref:uncharacterized protein LOC142331696 n=1 Tax=Lycorma delicatula TaxID=130591 RepID=UPI003F5115A2
METNLQRQGHSGGRDVYGANCGRIYISPNVDCRVFNSSLDVLQNVVNNTDKKIIMLGDFNSRLVATGGRRMNKRGELLTELMETVGCHCINDDTPTFEARGHTSILDLAILDNRWRNQQWNWEILQQDKASDHYATMLILEDISFKSNDQTPVLRFSVDQMDVITNRVAARLSTMENFAPEAFSNIIKQEMDKESRNGVKKHMVYWWTREIAYLRQTLQAKRRIKQRLRQ